MWIFIVAAVIVIAYLMLLVRSLSSDLEAYKNHLISSEDHNRALTKEIASYKQQLEQSETLARYKFDYIALLYPEINDLFEGKNIVYNAADGTRKTKNIFETVDLLHHPKTTKDREIINLKKRYEHLEKLQSNLTAIPYMAAIMADYETYGLEALAKQLDWGYATQRMHKVASIREIRRSAQEMVERNLEAKYQLAYLLQLFPALDDVIETDFRQLPVVTVDDLSEYDRTRDWLSKEEYQNLSSIERNQLALDRYMESHTKTKWQIGRDYELYVGYKCQQKGFSVDYFGSYMGLEDMGRDLIAKKDKKDFVIQCKYWGKEKVIHEKHITQLYGTMVSYCIENNIPRKNVKGVLVTNIHLSEQAKKMANHLKIKYVENFEKGTYPCVKCNIGHDEFGETKIYHLPFDQQYDSTKISSPGEFFAMTVKEAEDAGFRRAFRWHNNT